MRQSFPQGAQGRDSLAARLGETGWFTGTARVSTGAAGTTPRTHAFSQAAAPALQQQQQSSWMRACLAAVIVMSLLASLLLVFAVLASEAVAQREPVAQHEGAAASALRGLIKDKLLALMQQQQQQQGPAGVWLPSRFSSLLNNTLALATRRQPEKLGCKYAGKAPVSRLVKLHWVIIACDRRMWGRMMSHSLLSGLFNELKPTTISIVWCKPFKEGSYPALLHELRYSHSINVFFANSKVTQQTIAAAMGMDEGTTLNSTELRMTDPTYMTALMVPLMLGRPDLPLVISEDDAVFVPDANARLAKALTQIQPLVKNDPFLIQLYDHCRYIEPAPEHAELIDQPKDNAPSTHRAHDVESVKLRQQLTWGTQGFFFSPGMTLIFLNYWINMTLPGATHRNWGQDYHIVFYLKHTLECNKPGSHCWFYQMQPALTQHIGTSSSLFNIEGKLLNQKWHMSKSFPVRVAMPGYDKDGAWRRLARRLMARLGTREQA